MGSRGLPPQPGTPRRVTLRLAFNQRLAQRTAPSQPGLRGRVDGQIDGNGPLGPELSW